MRTTLGLVLVGLVLAPAAVGAVGMKAVLKAPSAQPKIDVKWRYSITAAVKGHPLRATVTAEIVDPFGGVHPVDYGPTQKPIVNLPFRGTFRDYVLFPSESRGFTLTLRWTVKAKIGAKTYRKVLIRKVKPG